MGERGNKRRNTGQRDRERSESVCNLLATQCACVHWGGLGMCVRARARACSQVLAWACLHGHVCLLCGGEWVYVDLDTLVCVDIGLGLF